ncbi:uncharacterized protein [Fopius arisanus]|uniref:Venom protein n=1 Tax=Fopius arisanus TaxID=64838 RepID=A0A9R1TDV2_9HYME|nr:PREDICTED: uncharacterized protein LOC105269001 [Fopius arisanus]
MKIFILICCFLPLTVCAYISEKDLYQYTVLHSNIRLINQVVSSYMLAVDNKTQWMAQRFHDNISSVREDFGEWYAVFKAKYEPKAAEFAHNLNLSEDCHQYILDGLKENDLHKDQLKNYTIEAIQSWSAGLQEVYGKLSVTRLALASIEMEAYRCGDLLKKSDDTLAYNCTRKALEKAETIKEKAIPEIYEEAKDLIKIHNTALNCLHQSIKDRNMAIFYDSFRTDDWLATFCSESEETDNDDRLVYHTE